MGIQCIVDAVKIYKEKRNEKFLNELTEDWKHEAVARGDRFFVSENKIAPGPFGPEAGVVGRVRRPMIAGRPDRPVVSGEIRQGGPLPFEAS